ncbi:MAG: AMP-binding protein [Kofleriaceae bacterium]
MSALAGHDDRVALVDAATQQRISYGELRERVAREAAGLRDAAGPDGIAVMFAANDVSSIVALYAGFAARVPVALFDRSLDDDRAHALLERYRPEVIRGRRFDTAVPRGGVAPDRELALLLSTSGTIGSPKLVRLAHAAVAANARSIAGVLGLGPDEVAITSLPIHYAYGLSVVISHLAAGATVVLTDHAVISDAFWQACRDHGVTSLAGVPYSYDMLRRIDLDRLAPPSLRTLTQAGGALDPGQVRRFHTIAANRGGQLFVMYGQTEATARIAVLPPSELPARAGWVGKAIPGGSLAIEAGEVVYRGANVMMGYAEQRDDLARGDELGGVLHTGDLGELDGEGFLRITGRSRRIAKVFGRRVSLDELQQLAHASAAGAAVAVIAGRDRVRVFVEGGGPPAVDSIRRGLAAATGLHHSGFEVVELPALPRLASGKLDYRALGAES